MSDYHVICSDALVALADIEDASVDVILTDPPFCSGARYETGRTKKGRQTFGGKGPWFDGDDLTTLGIMCLLRLLAIEWRRVLKPGGHALVFTDWRMAPHFGGAIESADLRRNGVVIWDKLTPGLGHHYRSQHEHVLHFSRGPGVGPFVRDGANVISVARPNPKTKRHPTEKPVALLRQLLRPVLPEGGHVVDCFAGSGSTGEAALEMGATVTLIERDPRHAGNIAERLRGWRPSERAKAA